MPGARLPWGNTSTGANLLPSAASPRYMPARPSSYNLLVVDDEPMALKLIERVFSAEADVDLRLTNSPVRALEIAERLELDVVVSDQRMPEMDGLAFLSRLRERRPSALTGAL